MRTIEINGKDFNSLDGFYDCIEKLLTDGECPWGRNFDSLDEIVYYQFNYTGDKTKDVNKIIWTDFEKSKSELTELAGDKKVIDVLEEIFQQNDEIDFIKS